MSRTPDDWYRRLHGILVGRHDLTPGRADELVAQARDHATLAGVAPEEEFGTVDAYAARLAAPEPPRSHREAWWRTPAARIALTAAATLIAVYWFADWLHHGYAWVALIVGVPAMAGLAWELVAAIRSRKQPAAGSDHSPFTSRPPRRSRLRP